MARCRCREGRLGVAGVERHSGRVDALLGGLRPSRALRGFPLADTQVKPGAFQQLALFRISLNDGAERGRGAIEVVFLKGADSCLVQGDRLVEGRLCVEGQEAPAAPAVRRAPLRGAGGGRARRSCRPTNGFRRSVDWARFALAPTLLSHAASPVGHSRPETLTNHVLRGQVGRRPDLAYWLFARICRARGRSRRPVSAGQVVAFVRAPSRRFRSKASYIGHIAKFSATAGWRLGHQLSFQDTCGGATINVYSPRGSCRKRQQIAKYGRTTNSSCSFRELAPHRDLPIPRICQRIRQRSFNRCGASNRISVRVSLGERLEPLSALAARDGGNPGRGTARRAGLRRRAPPSPRMDPESARP